jgi:LysM repeat protein
MSAWKDEKLAAGALNGEAKPKSAAMSLRVWLLGLGAVVTLLAAVLIMRAQPAQEPAARSTDTGDEAQQGTPPPEGAQIKITDPEVIVLPPITLNAKLASTPGAGLDVADAKDSAGGAAQNIAGLDEAKRTEAGASGDIAALEHARSLYQQALDGGKLDQASEKQCLERLLDLTNRLVLDPKTACTAPQAVFHKVESGDAAEKIARKYKVNQGQLKRINHLNDKLTVRYGQVLKMLPGEVLFRADRTRLTGTLYIDGVFVRRYPIGVGPGNATAKGVYHIERKVVNPDWYYDSKRIPYGDPANILGSRWMAFSETDNGGLGGGLGIHGTSLPQSVPGRESKGCIRMLNPDVEELYDFMPQGGKVEITD